MSDLVMEPDWLAGLRRRLPASAMNTAVEPAHDVCRFPLGQPRIVVTPEDTAQVKCVVEAARRSAVPVVPHGFMSGYWRPLHLDGAIALDVSALQGLRLEDDVVVCGAGVGFRRLDVWLRARGLHLPLRPDAFGETSIGAMVATGCTSGFGMGDGPLSRHITGLTVVTGAGKVVRTGASWGLRDTPPFLRDGLPDLTSAFIGSEGTLGVITEVALRPLPAPWRVRVHAELPGTAEVGVALCVLGRTLGASGVYDTYRGAREVEGNAANPCFALDTWIRSRWSAAEADERAERVASNIRAELGVTATVTPESEAARRGESPDYDLPWPGPEGSLAMMTEHFHLVGMDVNAPHACARDLMDLADAVAAEQHARGALQVRTALYLAPEFINLGLHSAFPVNQDTIAWSRTHVEKWLARLSRLPVVPYRTGRVWPVGDAGRITPEASSDLHALKRFFDPDGLMNPGHRLYPEPEPTMSW